MIKKISTQGAFARKEDYSYEGVNYTADIQNGDKVKILNEGELVTGQFGEQQVFKIETRNGEKNYPMGQKSINILVDAFGDDSKNWIGKEVNVITRKGVYAGKKGIASYMVVDGWELDEYGELVNPQKVDDGETEETFEEIIDAEM